MDKPDDIPQDVHDAVEAIMALVDAGADLSTEQCMELAIRAERERCARVADNTSTEYRAASSSCGYREDRRAFDDRTFGAAVVARNIRSGT